jgi:polar amino acid transport system permease protein
MEAIDSEFTFMLRGLGLSLAYSIGALVLALLFGGGLGTLFCAVRSRAVRWPILAWVGLFRNIPLIVQLYIWYLGLPYLGVQLSAANAGIVGLGLYGASYVTEIVRSGLGSVGRDQEEAALAVGLTRRTAVQKVIWPQALPVLIPPLTNEGVALFKNSALLGFIRVSGRLSGSRSA